jgi:excisionase family DNA binding protein
MNHQTPPATLTRVTLSVPEAAELLGISRNLGYEMARTRVLPTIRLGRRLVVPKTALDALLAAGR